MISDNTHLLDSPTVATLLGLARGSLANMRSRGEGPPFCRLGRAIRYRPEDVEAWVKSARVVPSQRKKQ